MKTAESLKSWAPGFKFIKNYIQKVITDVFTLSSPLTLLNKQFLCLKDKTILIVWELD